MATTKTKARRTVSNDTSARWRKAVVDDRQAIIAMSLALFSEDPGTFPLTARDVGRTLSVFEKEPGRGFAVVVCDRVEGVERVVGYAFLCAVWSNELRGEVCIVDELYVDPKARGRGLGSALLRQLVEQRRFFPRAVAFELEVTSSNPRARALYERLGFVPRKNATLRYLHQSS